MNKIYFVIALSLLVMPLAHAKKNRKPSSSHEYTRSDHSNSFGESVTITNFEFREKVTYKTQDSQNKTITCHANYRESDRATVWDTYDVSTKNDDCGQTISLSIKQKNPEQLKLQSSVDSDGGTPAMAVYSR